MSVTIQRSIDDAADLEADERIFLRERAFPQWENADLFSDEEVDRAKDLFGRVFALPNAKETLKGMRFEDALAMVDETGKNYYAMVVVEGQAAVEWLHAVVTITHFEFMPQHLGFREFLMILKTYEGRD